MGGNRLALDRYVIPRVSCSAEKNAVIGLSEDSAMPFELLEDTVDWSTSQPHLLHAS